MRILITSLLLLFSFSVFSQKILFVGNSLTYSNNMPRILETIAQKNSVQLKTSCLCFSNYALEDHLNSNALIQFLEKEKYDYVIVQQGPSSQTLGRQMLIRDGKKIKELCDKYKAKLGFYMVWPAKRYYFTFKDVIKSYELAAKKSNSLLFPVGKFWNEYSTHNNLVNLYDDDKFHPNKTGSFLVAITIFRTLYPKKKSFSYEDYSSFLFDKQSFQKIIEITNE